MSVHVERQVIDLVEGLRAHRALVRLLSAVRKFVILVVALLMETFPAVLAHERLVPCVDPRVGVEGRRPVERLATRVTLVRLLRSVYDLMTAQRRRLSEPLSTYFTHERPCASMHRHVPCQVVVSVEDLSALSALEALLLGGGRRPQRRFSILGALRSCRGDVLLVVVVVVRRGSAADRRGGGLVGHGVHRHRGKHGVVVDERVLVEEVLVGTQHRGDVLLEGGLELGDVGFGLLFVVRLHDLGDGEAEVPRCRRSALRHRRTGQQACRLFRHGGGVKGASERNNCAFSMHVARRWNCQHLWFWRL